MHCHSRDRRRSPTLLAALVLAACSSSAPPNRAVTAPPAPRERCEEHAAALRARLPGPGFHVAVEPPFVVIGEGAPLTPERGPLRLIRWTRDRLRADFFAADPTRVLEIWLFDGKASYQKHTRQVFGDTPTTPFGYYSSRHGALIMDISTGGGTLVHELVHPFVEANVPDCPSWLNEGLGSLFEQSTDRDGHIRGLVNWRLDALQEAIGEERTVPLATLVQTTSAQFYGARSGLHYAEARYLLLWLQEHDRLLTFWNAWLQARADDPTGAATLQTVLGTADLAAFQPRFESWVMGLRR